MQRTKKQLWCAAVHIHQWLVADSQPAQLPLSAERSWQLLHKLARQLITAERQGWLRAAQRLRTDLVGQTEQLREELAAQALSWQSAAARPTPVSPSEIFRELVALHDEFAEVGWDLTQRSLWVRTPRIVLEGIDLGPFQVVLEWPARRNEAEYRVVALEPHPCSTDEAVTHPHVSDNILCAGEGQPAIRVACAQGRLGDFFQLVLAVLNTYARGQAYTELVDWDGTRCTDCGCSIARADECSCYACDAILCADCRTFCEQCDDALCGSCVSSCQRCQRDCCRGCQERCEDCHQLLCPACRQDGICQACQNKGEPDDEHHTADPSTSEQATTPQVASCIPTSR